ncbi:MAG: polyprenyl synthetase family protein [Thermoguttaceae bacterium]
MTRIADDKTVAPKLLASIYASVQPEMDRVEEMLRRELRSDHPAVDELVRYGFRIGGKRLRPALVLLSGKATGELTDSHIVLSAVVEMIHTATLIHDDVLDEAALRRHVDTVNARWSNEKSVLLGDFLFTHAFYLASTMESTYACRTIGRATNIVCEGELRQTGGSGNFDLTEETYLDIIDSKTAELCACCCSLGAHYADADPNVEERLRSFGRWLGIAFQIADDLLDLVGDESTTGKSLGTDLEKRKATLPLIHLLAQASSEERADVMDILSGTTNGHRDQLLGALERCGAIEYTRAKAREYADRALACLAEVPPSESRDLLEYLTRFVVDRQE